MKSWIKRAAVLLAGLWMVMASVCFRAEAAQTEGDSAQTEGTSAQTEGTSAQAEEASAQEEKNGEVYILFTSDVHCGIEDGFGYEGLMAVRKSLEASGYETILVDDGDSVQGEAIGNLSEGETIIELMNEMGYDVAVPGNHEFDYGADHFVELTRKAAYPYICCNFVREGEPVLQPYVIKEAAGKKIAFVGVTTPETIATSLPASFKNDQGEFVYGFLQDETGEGVYDSVQNAVDAARAEGADLVYVMGHLGMEESCSPWTYADVISHTEGIDVFLDGHSHDTEQVVMKDRAGKEVTRSAVGTKLECIGYSRISAEGEILETGIWKWDNRISAPELFHLRSGISEKIEEKKQELAEQMNQVVVYSEVDLTIFDPEAVDSAGKPVRMVRRAETNLGDMIADAFRQQGEADIGFINGGTVRKDLYKGSITYGDIYNVLPFSHTLCVLELTGQQILDALEWGARSVPGENGAFLQVSGMSYEIHPEIDNPCLEDENGMFLGVEGARRVQNVRIGEEPLDPDRTYTVASIEYTLLEDGDGCTMFRGAPVLKDQVKLDVQLVIDFIWETMDGTVGEEYADPTGEGRITIVE